MFRSRVVLAIIGVILVGGVSTGVAMLSGTNMGSLVNATAARATATATAGTAATSTSSSTSDTTTSPASTATTSGAAPTRAPSGEVIDLHGTIASDPQNNQFMFTDDIGGTTWTVQVTPSTHYEGPTTPFAFGDLQKGRSAEVKGVITGGTTFRAYEVHEA